MQAWNYHTASPPNAFTTYADALDCSQASDSDSDCSSSATLASSASSQSTLASATSSMWSAPSSQQSYFTAPSVTGYESDYCAASQDASQQNRSVTRKLFGEALRPELEVQPQTRYQQSQAETVPLELRKNPRRTSAASSASRGCPPTLFRQSDRKGEFVDKLVDSATYIVEAIWPTSSVPCRAGFGTNPTVLPLRKFIEETLRRSRTSYSTLQVGLYYLILIKPHIPEHDFTMEQTDESHAHRILQCGRRMFLAALILASKWLQDRNYSAKAWSKISGLKVSEINENEIAFLAAVNWKLHVGEKLYKEWSECVMKYTPSLPPSSGNGASLLFEQECAAFKKLIQGLTPELDNLEYLVPVREELRMPLKRSAYPSVVEPRSAAMCIPHRQQLPTLPALGLLPTPLQLVPQSSCGFGTPAVSAASQLLSGRTGSMSSALSGSLGSHALERWATPLSSFGRTSPQSYVPTRRSSLANTVSTASSPESMVSDSSIQSRTSSVSSVSLTHNAPAYMQARRANGERQKLVYGQMYQSGLSSVDETLASQRKLAVADIVDLTGPSNFTESNVQVQSPESYSTYTGEDFSNTGKVQDTYQLSVQDAAYALQELHNHRVSEELTPRPVPSFAVPSSQAPKRKWTDDSDLQENVRGLLRTDNYPTTVYSTAYPTPQATPVGADWTAAKRPRLTPSDMYQREAYGQHLLIPSI
ncbi:G1/S-specific cyclin Pcl5 [Coniochaeta sp. 2T2.1]|nr:G1/S-specific cyclin Pcl5 [Coniochaeta sp. 2T2.1]